MGDSQTKTLLSSTASDAKKSEHIIIKYLLVIVIFILLAVPALLVKYNINGSGEKMRPLLENIPYVQNILPPKPDPEDPKYMNKSELIKEYRLYRERYDKKAQEAEQLKHLLETLDDIKKNYDQYLEEQKIFEQNKVLFEQEKEQLEKDKEDFFNDIKDSKKNDFRNYFEKINTEYAKILYEEILAEEKVNRQIKEYIAYYEKMESDSVAKIFNEMGVGKMDIILSIIKRINKEKAAEILSEIDVSLAAKIIARLADEYPVIN